MSNYRQCKAFLINAFLALDDETAEDERLRSAIERVLEAVARTERDAASCKAERLLTASISDDAAVGANSGSVIALRRGRY